MNAQLLVVGAGGRVFGIDARCVREITTLTPLTRIPGAGPAVRGLMNLRGQLFAVADLAEVVEGRGVTCAATASDVVVVSASGKTMALLVDDVRDVQTVSVDPGRESESAGPGGSGLIAGVGHFAETVVFHLDVPAVIRQTLA